MLAERERKLNEESAMTKQELEAERKRIADERAQALADAKKAGVTNPTVTAKAYVTPEAAPAEAAAIVSKEPLQAAQP